MFGSPIFTQLIASVEWYKGLEKEFSNKRNVGSPADGLVTKSGHFVVGIGPGV